MAVHESLDGHNPISSLRDLTHTFHKAAGLFSDNYEPGLQEPKFQVVSDAAL